MGKPKILPPPPAYSKARATFVMVQAISTQPGSGPVLGVADTLQGRALMMAQQLCRPSGDALRLLAGIA